VVLLQSSKKYYRTVSVYSGRKQALQFFLFGSCRKIWMLNRKKADAVPLFPEKLHVFRYLSISYLLWHVFTALSSGFHEDITSFWWLVFCKGKEKL